MILDPVQFFSSNTEFLFRLGLVMFIFGVILMVIDRDFNDKLEKNSFVAKLFLASILSLSISVILFTINRFLGLLFGPLALASSISCASALVFLILAMAPPEFILRRLEEF